LAGLLTGYELTLLEGDVAGATADDDDVELTEFSDEIEAGLLKNLLKLV
jgi:N utilization substance protein A